MLNCVITGTSQGIGLEFVRQMLQEGHKVFAVVRPSSHLQQLLALREMRPQQLIIEETDLKAPDAIEKIQHSLQSWNHVDILINNAGIYAKDDSPTDFTESFHVNTIVPYFMTKALMLKLKNSKHPKLVLISSQMGSVADNHSGGAYSYRASKAALNMIGKCFACDESWLTTLIFHPGWVQTRMGGEAAPVQPAAAVKGMLSLIYQASKTQSGSFQTFQGKNLPW